MKKLLCFGFLLVFCVGVPPASAVTTWVSATGGTTGSCGTAVGASDPGIYLRTINAGVGCIGTVTGAGANDTVIVKDGTYVEWLNNNFPSGTSWSAPFTLKAQNRLGAIIRPAAGSSSVMGVGSNAQYVIIDGFVMDGINIGGHAVRITGVSNIRFQFNEIKNVSLSDTPTQSNGGGVSDTTDACCNEYISNYIHTIGAGKYDHALYIKSANNLIERNVIADISGQAVDIASTVIPDIANNNIFRYNVIRDNGSRGFDPEFAVGLNVVRGVGNKIHNNIIYNNAGGIHLYNGANNTEVYNNTIYANNNGGPTAQNFCIKVTNADNVRIRNNICWNNNDGVFIVASTSDNLERSNNLCNTAAIGCSVTNDPQFVNEGTADLSLLSTSPAVNAGTVITTGCTANNCSGAFAGSAPNIGAHETIPTPLSASVEDGAANTLRINWPLNTAAFSPLASCTASDFVVRVNGASRTPSTCTIVGSNRTDVAFGGSAVTNGQSITFDYTAGTLRNSVDIGRGTGAVGSGSNQKVFSCTNCTTVQNNVAPGTCDATPTISSIVVQNATPTVATLCIGTNNPPMTPASPTECTGFTITGKTEATSSTSCIRNATNNKCFDFTVTSAFTAGEVQTASYDPATGNVLSSGTCTPELAAFSGQAIQNNVQGSAPTGLVAHFKLDDGSGTSAVDSSGNGNTGTLTNFAASPAWTATGVVGGALAFDGTDDYVAIGSPAVLNLTGEMTACAWAQFNDTTTTRAIISAATSGGIVGQAHLDIGRADTLINVLWANTVIDSSTTTLVTGTWYHVCSTRSGSTGNWTSRLYLNGVLDKELSGITTNPGIQRPFSIGRPGDFNGQYLSGILDDVRVYNTALTTAEVHALFAPGPVASSAVVDDATPTVVKFCASTNDPPLLPATDCELAGFAVNAGHTITDCDRVGASDPGDICYNLTVSPAFASGEPGRTLAYDPSLGNVTSSAVGNPELALFTGLPITNNVQPGLAINRDQELCRVECWGGDEDSPDCIFPSATVQQATYAGGCFRVRCSVDNEGTNDAGARGYTWYTSKNGAAYEAVTDTMSTDGIWFATPPELSVTKTTELLTVDPTNFIPGAKLTAAQVPLIPATGDPAFGSGKRTEFLGAFCIGSNATAGANCTADDWLFEARESDGTPLETYTVRPQVCVSNALGLSAGGAAAGGVRQ